MEEELSPLLRAILANDLPGVLEVIQNNPSSVNHVDDNAKTPLLLAASQFPTVVSILIDAGADVNAETATRIATERGIVPLRPLVVVADVKHHSKNDARAYVDAMRSLLRAGADVNIADGFGYTALHRVAEASPLSSATAVELASLLLDYGADVHQLNALNWSVVDVAYSSWNASVTPLLLSSGGRLVWHLEDSNHADCTNICLAALIGDVASVVSLIETTGVDMSCPHCLCHFRL